MNRTHLGLIVASGLLAADAQAQSATSLAGSVFHQKKISETEGGFTGVLSPGPDPYTDPGDLFGISVAGIGDLDHDGVEDLAVGAYADDEGGILTGAIWILFMNADQTVKGHQKISKFQGGFVGPIHKGDLWGWSLGFMGDLDQDGAPELAVGGWLDDDGFVDAGAVWILSLNPDGTVKREQKISATQGGFTGPLEPGERFGTSLVNLGDLDGDGVNDLAAGAVYDNSGGHLVGAEWILFLNPNGTVKSHTRITNGQGGFSAWITSYSRFSYSACSLGDLDGDGVVDLAVGAITDEPQMSGYHPSDFTCHNGCGAVWIVFLKPDGTVKTQQKIAQKEAGLDLPLGQYENFAHGVACPGDLNGDGIQDLLVGSVGADGDLGGGNVTGTVWVLFLNRNGTVQSWKKISKFKGGFSGDLDEGDFFGQTLCALGDLNGDGMGDVAVGAIGDDDGGADQGAIWFLYPYSPNWSNAGKPSAGSQGMPKLKVASTLKAGASVEVRLQDAALRAPAVLLVAPAGTPTPLNGGTLVPDVGGPHLMLSFLTDSAGELLLQATWPPGLLPGFGVYMQAWIKDAGVPSGWASSNSLQGLTQ
jgi:FG-GAP-like repeat